MAKTLKQLKLTFEPQCGRDKAIVKKHTIAVTDDKPKNDQAVFSGRKEAPYQKQCATTYEEVETIEELDAGTLKSYAGKAQQSFSKNPTKKRAVGIKTAMKKMRDKPQNEDLELAREYLIALHDRDDITEEDEQILDEMLATDEGTKLALMISMALDEQDISELNASPSGMISSLTGVANRSARSFKKHLHAHPERAKVHQDIAVALKAGNVQSAQELRKRLRTLPKK